MIPEGFRDITLDAGRVPGGLALSQEAGWNQIAADWRFMLANGAGFGVIDGQDRLIASGLTVEFPDYAWISMILVTKSCQRLGLATHLMGRCTRRLARRGLVPALDASAQGRPVYLRQGFREIDSSTRLAGPAGGGRMDGDVTPIAPEDMAGVAAYDRAVSGTDRTGLLTHLLSRCPEAAFVARRNGGIAGFVLARDGRNAHQIGPLSADDDRTAETLLVAARGGVGGPACLDVVDRHRRMKAGLQGAGFGPVTHFSRMVLGDAAAVPTDPRAYVTGGPELS